MDMNVPQQLLQVREASLAHHMTGALEYHFSRQLDARFDTKQHAMWSR